MTNGHVNSNGPMVQIYDKYDLTKLIHVFESLTDAVRQIKYSSFSHIKTASKHKTEYLGYRWNLIMREDPNARNSIDIGDTFVVRNRSTGHIAMMNLGKDVLQVFETQNDAAKYIERSKACICLAIKNKTQTCGYYFAYWQDIEKDQQDKYLKLNELPEKKGNIMGRKVQLFNAATTELIKTFPTIADCTKAMKISPNSIKMWSETENVNNGFKYKLID